FGFAPQRGDCRAFEQRAFRKRSERPESGPTGLAQALVALLQRLLEVRVTFVRFDVQHIEERRLAAPQLELAQVFVCAVYETDIAVFPNHLAMSREPGSREADCLRVIAKETHE